MAMVCLWLWLQLGNDVTVNQGDLPKLPGKKWFGNDTLSTLEKRKAAFNKYLEACRKSASLRHSTAYLGFLDADEHEDVLHFHSAPTRGRCCVPV